MATCNTYLKDEMRRQGVSQYTMADKLGINQGTLCRLLNNSREMRIGELIRIAEELNISNRELAKMVADDAKERRTKQATRKPSKPREGLRVVESEEAADEN